MPEPEPVVMSSVAAEGSLQIRVELRDVEPTVWRRILVPDGITMAELAEILLIAMGWGNVHLHLFEVGDKVYGSADDEAEDDEIDESGVIVSDALGRHDRFDFEYDFGDGWDHDVVIEERSSSTVDFADCLGGENACPPEDVGGPGGYRDFLERDRRSREKITRSTLNGSEDRSTRSSSTLTASTLPFVCWRSPELRWRELAEPTRTAVRVSQAVMKRPHPCFRGGREERGSSVESPPFVLALDGVTTHGTTHGCVHSVRGEHAEVAITVDDRNPPHVARQHLAEGRAQRGPTGTWTSKGTRWSSTDPVKLGSRSTQPWRWARSSTTTAHRLSEPPTAARTSSID